MKKVIVTFTEHFGPGMATHLASQHLAIGGGDLNGGTSSFPVAGTKFRALVTSKPRKAREATISIHVEASE